MMFETITSYDYLTLCRNIRYFRNILFSFGEKKSFDLFHLGGFPCFVVLFLEMTIDEPSISKANNVRNGCNFSPINWHFETL